VAWYVCHWQTGCRFGGGAELQRLQNQGLTRPQYYNKCRKKIQDRIGAVQPDGNEWTVTVESGQGEGGSGGPAGNRAQKVLRLVQYIMTEERQTFFSELDQGSV
jgi:hypothetical protein